MDPPIIGRESDFHNVDFGPVFVPPSAPGHNSIDVLVAAVNKVEKEKSIKPKLFKKKKFLQKKIVLVDPTLTNINKKQTETKETTSSQSISSNENMDITNTDTSPPNKGEFRKLYDKNDPGPYMVHVQFTEVDNKKGSTLHPLDFSYFLHKKGLRNIIENGIKRIGRNRLSISFTSGKDANEFIQNETLAETKKYTTSIPIFNICRMGIVKGVPEDWSHEDIMANIRVPNGFGAIIRTRRMCRKSVSSSGVEWIPTQSVTLTFDGQCLPPRVFAFYSSLPVEKYILPTIQCFQCCRFGHTRDKCRSQPRCLKCGDNHDGKSCNSETFHCINCSGPHKATDKTCPEFLRQANIKNHMSYNNVSYIEASKAFPASKPLFSEVVALSSQISDMSPPENKKIWHKKTVFSQPKKKIITQNKGYDQEAHKNIINSYKEPSPQNGCALTGDNNNSSSEDASIQELLSTLVNTIFNSSLPYSVALKLVNTISVTILNFKHGLSDSMESEKRQI